MRTLLLEPAADMGTVLESVVFYTVINHRISSLIL
jgi:hypothetical protein